MRKDDYKGFLLMLTHNQKARLKAKADKYTDGNITLLLQRYAEEVDDDSDK